MAEARLTPPPDSLDQAAFLRQFGGIYEHSQWVADQLWDEGVGPADARVSHFAARMAAVVDAASDTHKLALLRAHPELPASWRWGAG